MVAASCKDALIWSLTPGQAGDSPEGRKLVEAIDAQDSAVYLLMDSAYDSDDLLATAANRSLIPVVPAQPQRKSPWIPDK